jgi:hypothetical protein
MFIYTSVTLLRLSHRPPPVQSSITFLTASQPSNLLLVPSITSLKRVYGGRPKVKEVKEHAFRRG